jgi:hypothetical protein
MFAVHDANLFILVYRDPDLASGVVEQFMLKLYRPHARTFRDRGTLKEAQLADDTWVIAYHQGRLVIVVPPTRALSPVKQTIQQYLANLASPKQSH